MTTTPDLTDDEVFLSIVEEIRGNPTLRNCWNFTELHDHCDANCLGLSEKLWESVGQEESVRRLNAIFELPETCPECGDLLEVESRMGGVFTVFVKEHVGKDVWRGKIEMPLNPDFHGFEHLFSVTEIKKRL